MRERGWHETPEQEERERRGWHETADEEEERELRQLERLGHELHLARYSDDETGTVVHVLACEKCGRSAVGLSLRESCRRNTKEES